MISQLLKIIEYFDFGQPKSKKLNIITLKKTKQYGNI